MENKPLERWHGAHHYSNKVHFALVVFLILAAIALIYFFFSIKSLDFSAVPIPTLMPELSQPPTPTPTSKSRGNQVICTQDAMQCPNGTWVGRTGPNCEFICP